MTYPSSPPGRRLSLGFLFAILIMAIAALVYLERRSQRERANESRAPSADPPPVVLTTVAATAATPRTVAAPSPSRTGMADELNAPGNDPRVDLAIVGNLLAQYRAAFQAMPAGDNAQVTSALSGHNPDAIVLLPADHPAVNGRGELCDRWGTPLGFRPVSAEQVEVRSAGPDRRRDTADDLVWPRLDLASGPATSVVDSGATSALPAGETD